MSFTDTQQLHHAAFPGLLFSDRLQILEEVSPIEQSKLIAELQKGNSSSFLSLLNHVLNVNPGSLYIERSCPPTPAHTHICARTRRTHDTRTHTHNAHTHSTHHRRQRIGAQYTCQRMSNGALTRVLSALTVCVDGVRRDNRSAHGEQRARESECLHGAHGTAGQVRTLPKHKLPFHRGFASNRTMMCSIGNHKRIVPTHEHYNNIISRLSYLWLNCYIITFSILLSSTQK